MMDEHGQEIEQTTLALAPETEVALEVSRRLPLLLLLAVVLTVGCIAWWRMIRRDEVVASLTETELRSQSWSTPPDAASAPSRLPTK